MKQANKVKIQPRFPKPLDGELLKALPELLPSLRVTRAVRGPGLGGAAPDLLVEVRTPSGRKRMLRVEVRAANAPSRIPHGLRQLKTGRDPASGAYPVLASTFLSPRARELCRQEGIGYLDLAGNCYLQFDDFHLQKIVETNPFRRPGRPASLFGPVSSRLLRAMLEEPQRAWQVVELAATARVSLGLASKVCRRLLDEAYAAKADGRLRLAQPGALLDAWQAAYDATQNGAEAYYSFEAADGGLLSRVAAVARERRWRYAVTSFAAAALVAPFVHGIGTVQWYSDEESERWIEALDLRPAEAGPNAILLRPYDDGVFYRSQTVQGVTTVGSIQLYLDLAGEPARGREQAAFLRKARIGF